MACSRAKFGLPLNFQWVEHVLAEERYDTFELPKMPNEENWQMINTLMYYEEKLRNNKLLMDWQAIQQTGLSPYWQQIFLVMPQWLINLINIMMY